MLSFLKGELFIHNRFGEGVVTNTNWRKYDDKRVK